MTEETTRAYSAGERSYTVPAEVPVLPLRDTVLFPNSFMPLAVARESSVKLVDEAIAGGKLIGVFTQRDPTHEDPGQADLYSTGTLTHIHKMFKLPDGSLRLIVQGLGRIQLTKLTATRPYLRAEVSEAPEVVRDTDTIEVDALQRNVRANFEKVVSLSPVLSDDLTALAANITHAGRLADFVASSLTSIPTATKQELLETSDVRARMDQLNRILTKELEVLELGSKIQSQVQSEVGKNQREYFLREQMKATNCARRSSPQACPRTSRRKRCASSIGSPRCRSRPPNTPSHGLTSTGSWRCPGPSAPTRSSISSRPRACSTRITRASIARRTASSSTSRSASSSPT
jgi:ATP-dependent Lon protease